MMCILQSFVDRKCSGLSGCQFWVAEPAGPVHDIRPCPPELPPYLGSSYMCIPGNIIKVVPGGYHRYFFGVKLKAATYACPNHTDDGIYSDHGYLDTLDNLLGPP